MKIGSSFNTLQSNAARRPIAYRQMEFFYLYHTGQAGSYRARVKVGCRKLFSYSVLISIKPLSLIYYNSMKLEQFASVWLIFQRIQAFSSAIYFYFHHWIATSIITKSLDTNELLRNKLNKFDFARPTTRSQRTQTSMLLITNKTLNCLGAVTKICK